jgi:hypothetical protein
MHERQHRQGGCRINAHEQLCNSVPEVGAQVFGPTKARGLLLLSGGAAAAHGGRLRPVPEAAVDEAEQAGRISGGVRRGVPVPARLPEETMAAVQLHAQAGKTGCCVARHGRQRMYTVSDTGAENDPEAHARQPQRKVRCSEFANPLQCWTQTYGFGVVHGVMVNLQPACWRAVPRRASAAALSCRRDAASSLPWRPPLWCCAPARAPRQPAAPSPVMAEVLASDVQR